MPTYQMRAPDGQTYRIEGPEGANDEQVRGEIIRQFPHLGESAPAAAPAAPPPAAAEGAAAGIGQVLGAIPWFPKMARFIRAVRENPPPSIAGIGEIARQAPQEAMAAAEGAPFNPAITLSAAAMGLTPAPAFRIPTGSPLPGRPPTPLTSGELATARTGNYRAAEAAGVELPAQVMHEPYQRVLNDLLAREPNLETRAPDTFKALKAGVEATAPTKQPETLPATQYVTGYRAPPPKPVTGADLRLKLEQLGNIQPTAAGGTDAYFARLAKNALDETIQGLPAEAAMRGDLATFQRNLAEARANNAAMERMKVLEAGAERMEQGSTAQQAFKPLVRPPLRGGPTVLQKEGFAPLEQQAVRQIAFPSLTRRALEGIGEVGAAPWWAQIGTAAVTKGTSIPFQLAAKAFGGTARGISSRLADRAVLRALAQTAGRSPAAQQASARYLQEHARYLQALERARSAAPAAALLGGEEAYRLLPAGQ